MKEEQFVRKEAERGLSLRQRRRELSSNILEHLRKKKKKKNKINSQEEEEDHD